MESILVNRGKDVCKSWKAVNHGNVDSRRRREKKSGFQGVLEGFCVFFGPPQAENFDILEVLNRGKSSCKSWKICF